MRQFSFRIYDDFSHRIVVDIDGEAVQAQVTKLRAVCLPLSSERDRMVMKARCPALAYGQGQEAGAGH